MITAAIVRDRLIYDPETGVFRYRQSGFGRMAGAVAGCVQPNGYVKMSLNGKNGWAHRIAWLYVYGEHPSGNIDHIDGNQANNAIANLRVCDQSQNGANAKRRVDNSTGFKGVFYRKDTGRFTAYLTVKYKRKSLGCFNTAEEAHRAYVAAAEQHFNQFARAA